MNDEDVPGYETQDTFLCPKIFFSYSSSVHLLLPLAKLQIPFQIKDQEGFRFCSFSIGMRKKESRDIKFPLTVLLSTGCKNGTGEKEREGESESQRVRERENEILERLFLLIK